MFAIARPPSHEANRMAALAEIARRDKVLLASMPPGIETTGSPITADMAADVEILTERPPDLAYQSPVNVVTGNQSSPPGSLTAMRGQPGSRKSRTQTQPDNAVNTVSLMYGQIASLAGRMNTRDVTRQPASAQPPPPAVSHRGTEPSIPRISLPLRQPL